jgi:hypothetical protein
MSIQKSAIDEMPLGSGANDDDPLPSKKGANDKGTPPLEELIAENKRKAEEIASFKSEIQDMRAELDELKSLQQEHPTEKRQEKIDDIEESLDVMAEKLYQQKETKPWIRVAQKESENTVMKILQNQAVQDSNDFIDDKAEELGLNVKDLVKNIKSFAIKYSDRSPLRRTQLALRDWQKAQSKEADLSAREKKLLEEENKAKLMREGRGRIPVEQGKQDKWNNARNSRERTNAVVDMLETIK